MFIALPCSAIFFVLHLFTPLLKSFTSKQKTDFNKTGLLTVAYYINYINYLTSFTRRTENPQEIKTSPLVL